MRKPTVFLSHSKADKVIIERLANDLRRARINVWYDEWEIPPGESFRRKIFIDGIPNCDLFFTYITPNSSDSIWVGRELDAAFIQDTNPETGGMAIFVNSDSTRDSLSPDIRALHSPVLSGEDQVYSAALANLISRTWEITANNLLKEGEKNLEFEKLKLEKKIADLENQLLRQAQEDRLVRKEELIQFLENKKYTLDSVTLSLKEIFFGLSNLLASGTNEGHFSVRVGNMFGMERLAYGSPVRPYDIFGELIKKGLLKRDSATDQYDEIYTLTDLGISLANEMN